MRQSLKRVLPGLALTLLTASAARAASSAQLNIDVTITQNLSVSVNGSQSSTETVNWNLSTANQRLVPPGLATATVRNDSGAQTERWELKTNLNTIPASGTDSWTVVGDSSTVGAEQFALQALFGSSMTAAGGCPGAASADWDQDYADEVTTASKVYSSTLFADPNLNNDGTPAPDIPGNGRMHAGSQRALCWRVITPASTVATATQNIQLIVTALSP